MFKQIKIRLYPTVKQKKVLDVHFDGYRFSYNLCLDYKSSLWRHYKKNVSGFDMQKELFEIRKEVSWLSNCKAECIRDAALNVDKNYKSFFNGNGFPKYKSKRGTQSFSAYQNIRVKLFKLSFFGNKIKLKTSEHYHNLLESHKIKRCTFKQDSCGDYWATLLIETAETKILPMTDDSIGIDLGIKDILTTSEGKVFENKQFLRRNYYKMRSLQRRFEKSEKGGANRLKLKHKIARLNRKIFNQKTHYYHQITNSLLNDNQVIVMETLNVKGMLKNGKLSRSISDASWGMLTQMLEYKCNWYGRELIKINRWFPSSKTCSGCGSVKDKLLLSERIYKCESCGIEIYRDLNAAINIKTEGIKIPRLSVEDSRISEASEAESNLNAILNHESETRTQRNQGGKEDLLPDLPRQI